MPRTAQQLITDALATGTYAGYIGDGASVPWQVALSAGLPIGLTMFMYKAYLDVRWPHAFKLHDWCYTPYGGLINCTREEADQALFELIAVDSPIDAAIVFAAVTVGGGPWFGHATAGYSGIQAPMPVDNMPSTPTGCKCGVFPAGRCDHG